MPDKPTSGRSRQRVSTGSPYEPRIGISRAVRAGNIIAVAGTAPLGPDGGARRPGRTLANTVMQVTRFINPDWLVEVEADAVVED